MCLLFNIKCSVLQARLNMAGTCSPEIIHTDWLQDFKETLTAGKVIPWQLIMIQFAPLAPP